MSEALTDKTGEAVTVDLDEARGAYVIMDASGTDAGRAFYITGPDGARIFHHTEVDDAFGGRGLSKVLIAQSLEGSREQGVTVVPVCPLFVKKLADTGDDYLAQGGRFRKATGADIDLVKREA
ncbi:MAG: N-acetyltransferase [Brevibacterium sp.]|uniref:N-acetyltransferase domain-containing protein n=1 Tax=Brevibacterium antiquum CNRZ 918 TaxID=1255637 RepID=A0A2H1ICI5_9MICO|nr:MULTISPECIES: GNAT family N-acetyltransferase [Brevibacterium]MDN5808124.1 N-acetyltransferase [Brevibacterium sp.]MDN5877893.1 N-acetyltransferase [Brevibacterium sp.]MDN5910233.1 N-acetyltransferase [Brevibacterium sp.]MDN6124555.1 N-acetyltransferase [Brevibacterium sp.]MDN6158882.1 N-acetyltransferase [Brevibacterium sp.]